MNLLHLIYLLSFLSFNSLVLIFAFLFGAIPGNWYKRKLPQLQFIFATISFLSGGLNCIIALINDAYLNEINTLYTFSFLIILEPLYAFAFFASIYKLVKRRQTNKVLPDEYIFLRGSEYQITNKLEYTLSNLIYMPNVQSYAIAKDYTIIFSGARPEKEIDAKFICKKIGDKAYDCLSYIDLDKRFSLKRIFNHIVNCFILIVSLSIPFLIHYTDSALMATGNVDELYPLYVFVILFLLGTLECKLFRGIKGFSKIFYYLALIMVIFSFGYLIQFLI